MPLTLSIAAYFLAAALVWAMSRSGSRIATFVAAIPYVAQLALVALVAIGSLEMGRETIDWIPSLSVALAFVGNPLTLTLTTVVAGIGLLIVVYSHAYFADPERRAQFLAMTLVFTGGMAGVVASDELMGLFVFWEVTTVASYLLIGFEHEKAAARSAALEAVLVTTLGGLAMLGGFVLLIIESGTSSISGMVASPPSGAITTTAILLVFVGAFAKSAQFPFHFWLPRAMAAPTPASAYLHSATMVKAGIVLLLFLAPGFSSMPIWVGMVTTVGLATMAIGALTALRHTDMKLLLAHGTVSQLGFMTALIGLGHTSAALAVLVGHSAFKAALFLVTGIVDKATGTRDLDELTGLRRAMPVVAASGAVAALSMAGFPPLLGFVTKEAALDTLVKNGDWISLVVIAAASILTVVYSARWWFGSFGGPPADESAKTPYPAMVAPVVVLAVVTIGLGLAPAALKDVITEATGQAIKLVLWPGLGVPLAISVGILVVGAMAFALTERTGIGVPSLPATAPTGQGFYEGAIRSLNRTADTVTGIVQNGSLPVYLAVIVSTVVGVPAIAWALDWDATLSLALWNSPAEVALVITVVVGAVAATRARRRMAAALLLGVVGYAVAGVFVVFSAPDLALTQLLVETLTVALFALVLAKLPRLFGRGASALATPVRIAIAVGVGVFVTIAAAMTSTVEPSRDLVDRYIAESVDAGGTNTVNVILTNFRALDTLGEITVLAAAAVGIAALVGSTRRSKGDLE